MKKLLLLLLCVPLMTLAQQTGCIKGDCESGYGTYKYSGDWEGDKYVGEWKDNKKDGIGKLTYSDGRVEEGRFMIGVYIGKE